MPRENPALKVGRFRYAAHCVLRIFVFCGLTGLGIAQLNTPAPKDLSAGVRFTRELRAGAADHYQVQLSAGDFLELRVQQHAMDVEVSVANAEGKTLVTVDSPSGDRAPEVVRFLADTSGTYVLTISAEEHHKTNGKYEIVSLAIRPHTTADRKKMDGQTAFAAGLGSFFKRTSEGMKSAVPLLSIASSMVF